MKAGNKFFGLLKGKNLDLLDENLLKILIEHNIYIEKTPISNLEPTNSDSLSELLYFNGKHYEINYDLLEEIYNFLKLHIETHADPNYDLEPIKHQVNSFIDNDKKIEFLKQKFKEIYPKDWQLYPRYIGQGSNGIEDWKSWVSFNVAESHNFLRIYLTSDRFSKNSSGSIEEIELNNIEDYLILMKALSESKNQLEQDGFYELMEDWQMFYEVNFQLSYIENKIKE